MAVRSDLLKNAPETTGGVLEVVSEDGKRVIALPIRPVRSPATGHTDL